MLTPEKTVIDNLGERLLDSPLQFSSTRGDGIGNYTLDDARIGYDIDLGTGEQDIPGVFFEKAGAREAIFFEPSRTTAAIVTCGGLCPGLNNVIRSLVNQLARYGVEDVLGIRDGFKGLNPAVASPPLELDEDVVDHIHHSGGTILGTSRGPQPTGAIVDYLEQRGIDILFCIGGDGTQRGNHEIAVECRRRGLAVACVGIPKTIDNDISFISRSFGYLTALEEARKVLDCAHTEAKSAINGIGLVKLMGRESGFIAAGATLASQEVNFALVPEVPFRLEGEGGLLGLIEERMRRKQHAVIVVAEGAGQELFAESGEARDKSGNRRLQDIGYLLSGRIRDHFAALGLEVNLKYIDPSYIIRSVAANCADALLCDSLARNAVHAAMAGKTDCLLGTMHEQFIHVPLTLATEQRKKLDPESDLWIRVHESTGQPLSFITPPSAHTRSVCGAGCGD